MGEKEISLVGEGEVKDLNFECECGEKFILSIDSSKVDYEYHCQGGDEYCSCGGTTYHADCPKCGKDCEWYS